MVDISIIVPIYNVEKYLIQCIKSLLQQTHKNIEIVLIDDGSTDNSAEICDNYAKEDIRIKVIHQKNLGVSVARNNGFLVSTGEYILFVDPDDWLELDICEKAYNEAIRLKVDILYFNYYTHTKAKKRSAEFRYSYNRLLTRTEVISMQMSVLRLSSVHLGVPWGKIYRRKYIAENNLFFCPNITRMQDAIFNLHVMEFNPSCAGISIYGYNYRLREYTTNNRIRPVKSFVSFYEEMSKYINRNGVNDSAYYDTFGELVIGIIHYIISPCFYNNIKAKDLLNRLYEILSYNEIRDVLNNLEIKKIKNFKTKMPAFLLKYNMYHFYLVISKIYIKLKMVLNGKHFE